MAVAEARKMEKSETGTTSPPEWLTWAPRKFTEIKTFFAEVRAELKKVTWPSKQEVQATTVVVVVTAVFFGFYLWALDLVFSQALSRVLK